MSCFPPYKKLIPVNKQKGLHINCKVLQAALPGFEPGDDGVRVRCLTIWRQRYNFVQPTKLISLIAVGWAVRISCVPLVLYTM